MPTFFIRPTEPTPLCSAIDGLMRRNRCSYCSKEKAYKGNDARARDEYLCHLRHLVHFHEAHHFQSQILTADDIEHIKDTKDGLRARSRGMADALLHEVAGTVRPVAARGANTRGPNKKRPTKFHCSICNMNFKTTIGAMLARNHVHEIDGAIKVGKMKKYNEFVPEQHLFPPSISRYSWGSDALLHKVFPPKGAVWKDQKGITFLKCRFCKKYKIEYEKKKWEAKFTLHSLSHKISRHRAHEERCSKADREL